MKVFFTNVEAQASKSAYDILKNEEHLEIVGHKGPISEKELSKAVEDFEVIVVDGRAHVSEEVINAGKKLRLLARTGIGLNNIDVQTATERGIFVTYTPGANARGVAEQAFTMMMSSSRKLLLADRATRNGNYGFRNKNIGVELQKKTLGIIGLGAIGKHLARIAYHGFEMKILVFDPYLTHQDVEEHNAELVELERIIIESDYISVNCPLTDETRGLLGENEFKKMKKTAFVVNTARGGIIDEKALYHALTNGDIAGAGLDVLEGEPELDPENPLFKLDNIIFAPHCGGITEEALQRVGEDVADSVMKMLQNEIPRKELVVNKKLLSDT
jgi:D-3-phosphoglycerate dehydrogenase